MVGLVMGTVTLMRTIVGVCPTCGRSASILATGDAIEAAQADVDLWLIDHVCVPQFTTRDVPGLAIDCTRCGGGIEVVGRDESSRAAVKRWQIKHTCPIHPNGI